MNESTYRNDLFDQENLNGEQGKRSVLRRFSQQQLLPFIKVPIEFVVIGAISFLVILVVVYAVGVEVGKNSYVMEMVSDNSELAVTKKDPPDSTEAQETDSDTKQLASQNITEAVSEKPVSEEMDGEVPVKMEKGKYAIQLAAFRKLSVAEEEYEDIISRGHKAEIKKSNKWYQLLAYGYETMEQAEKAKRVFQRDYKDCFIKNIER